MNQLYSPALGGVKVQVLAVNLKEAQDILASVPDVELQDEEALSATPVEEPGPRPAESGRRKLPKMPPVWTLLCTRQDRKIL